MPGWLEARFSIKRLFVDTARAGILDRDRKRTAFKQGVGQSFGGIAGSERDFDQHDTR